MRSGRVASVIGSTLLATVIAAPLASSAPAAPTAVDLELVLATDNSQSVDPSEARLQRQGVAAAFKHPEVVRAIQSGSLGRIAVAYLDWSSEPYTKVTLDWRVISDKASADAFADALLEAPRRLWPRHRHRGSALDRCAHDRDQQFSRHAAERRCFRRWPEQHGASCV